MPAATLVSAVGFHLLVLVLLAIAVSLRFKPGLWFPLLSVFWGLLTAFIDLLSHAVQLPALMLLAGGFFLAFAKPQHAWRWAVLISLWIPLGEVIRLLAGVSVLPHHSHPGASILAFVPALIGAAGGVLISREAAHTMPPEDLS